MAIKNLIARGIGFTPGSISYIPTLGFSIEAVAAAVHDPRAARVVRGAPVAGVVRHETVSGISHGTGAVGKVVK